MTNIAITQLNDGTSTRLRDRAAASGRSVEEEACLLICRAIGHAPCWRDLASIIRSRFGPANGVDLALPSCEPGREPPTVACVAVGGGAA